MQHQPAHFSFGSSNIGKCKHHRSSDMCLWDFPKLIPFVSLDHFAVLIRPSYCKQSICAMHFCSCSPVLTLRLSFGEAVQKVAKQIGKAWTRVGVNVVKDVCLKLRSAVLERCQRKFSQEPLFLLLEEHAPLSDHDWWICPSHIGRPGKGRREEKGSGRTFALGSLLHAFANWTQIFLVFFNLYVVLIHLWGLCLTSQAAGLFPQENLKIR